MATVSSVCEVCGGRRFQASVLDHTFGGLNIADVLDLPADRAAEFFSTGEATLPAAAKILARLVDVGLGYVRLAQPLTTLSGGERQRLKLAARMGDELAAANTAADGSLEWEYLVWVGTRS